MNGQGVSELAWLALLRRGGVRRFLSQGGGQVDLVFLLGHKDLANVLRNRKFAERLALPDPFAVVANRLVFGIQVELEHGARIVGRLDRKSTRLNSSHANISY